MALHEAIAKGLTTIPLADKIPKPADEKTAQKVRDFVTSVQ